MTGPLAPRVVVAADAADYKKGARLCRGLCRRVGSPQGKRLTMICASLVLLQIMFAVHRFAQGATALRAEGDGGALRAMSFIDLFQRPAPSTTGVVPLPLQAGGGKFTGERLSPAPLGSVSLDSQSHKGSLRIQFPCHREWGRRKVCRDAVSFTPAREYP